MNYIPILLLCLICNEHWAAEYSANMQLNITTACYDIDDEAEDEICEHPSKDYPTAIYHDMQKSQQKVLDKYHYLSGIHGYLSDDKKNIQLVKKIGNLLDRFILVLAEQHNDFLESCHWMANGKKVYYSSYIFNPFVRLKCEKQKEEHTEPESMPKNYRSLRLNQKILAITRDFIEKHSISFNNEKLKTMNHFFALFIPQNGRIFASENIDQYVKESREQGEELQMDSSFFEHVDQIEQIYKKMTDNNNKNTNIWAGHFSPDKQLIEFKETAAAERFYRKFRRTYQGHHDNDIVQMAEEYLCLKKRIKVALEEKQNT